MSGFTGDGYYSYDNLKGGYNGLVRVSGGGVVFERVQRGAWVADQDLARHFVDPGTTFLEPVDGDVLRELAGRYGVDPQDPDPSFTSPKRPRVESDSAPF